MNYKSNFDGYAYFAQLCTKNKLSLQEQFKFCRVTGLGGMEEALANLKRERCFFCIDDTTDGATIRRSGGFYKRRVYTVFLLKRYKFGDMSAHRDALNVCRQLFDQIVSRMLIDKDKLDSDLIYMNTDRIHFREMEKYFLSGCAGIYFMIDVDEPLDLRYEAEEWDQ